MTQCRTGLCFNIRHDVLSWDAVKSVSREIVSWNYRNALKFDRHVGNTAAEAPVKFEIDPTILNTNLSALHCEICMVQDVLYDIETEPRWHAMAPSSSTSV